MLEQLHLSWAAPLAPIFLPYPPLSTPVDTGAKLPGRGGEGPCGVCLRAFVCVCV